MTDKNFANHFLLVIAVLVGITALILIIATSLSSINQTTDIAMIDSMEQRLAPVGKVYVGEVPTSAGAGSKPQLKAVGVAEKFEGASSDIAMSGKNIYTSTCAACHSTGIAGSPIFGDKAAWKTRVATGIQTLYSAALNGKGAMPAKGGNPSLSDEAIKGAVDYMINSIH